MKTEPVISTATITAAVSAVIGVLVAFGVPLTDDQKVAVLALVGVAAPLVVILARKYVTPNASVVERDDAGTVVAGEGSELPTGTVVRPAGSLDGASGDTYTVNGYSAEDVAAQIDKAKGDARATYAPADNA